MHLKFVSISFAMLGSIASALPVATEPDVHVHAAENKNAAQLESCVSHEASATESGLCPFGYQEV
ncbi:hypothetical protein ANO14919_061770 [Xylariales sp. No.14919]|nr:hypothetical protein ANO14919_061770 [Xylariales sp. No.14919]